MKGPERYRAPAGLSFAAPFVWWAPAFIAGAIVGAVLDASGGPWWLLVRRGLLAASVVDAYWRRTRPPSVDGSWSPLARLFFRRSRVDSS